MTDEIKTPDAGTADKAKLAVAILIVIAGVTAYYLLPLEATWLRWGAVVASLVLAAVVVWFSWECSSGCWTWYWRGRRAC